jgi:hypothetical protein
MDMERAGGASGSTTSFMSGVDSRAQLGGEPAPDANGYQALPGSPSKLSDELARRLALADSNPAQPQASWARHQPGACCLPEGLGWEACKADAECVNQSQQQKQLWGHQHAALRCALLRRRCIPDTRGPSLCWLIADVAYAGSIQARATCCHSHRSNIRSISLS